jgi:hypothetical protein
MHGQQAAFVELRLPDYQTVGGDIIKAQGQGLRDSHARGGQKAEQRCVDHRPVQFARAQRRGGFHKAGDVFR